jgi:hypothetical protein
MDEDELDAVDGVASLTPTSEGRAPSWGHDSLGGGGGGGASRKFLEHLQARSIHWSPYDRVVVVNAVP